MIPGAGRERRTQRDRPAPQWRRRITGPFCVPRVNPGPAVDAQRA